MKSSKSEQKKAAGEVIERLFSEARKNPEMGDRYVQLARRIAMKVNYRLPSELKRRFCRHCYSYFYDGNYRVRTRNKMVVCYCHKCKKYSKFGIRKKS